MIEKYTISFSVEADLKDKEELAAMIWTLLKVGKQVCGESPMTVPALKDINVEAGFCDEPYQPFRFFLMSKDNFNVTEEMVPTCYAARFHELSDAISDHKARGSAIGVFYIPKGTKQSEGLFVYGYASTLGVYKDYAFFREHPELA